MLLRADANGRLTGLAVSSPSYQDLSMAKIPQLRAGQRLSDKERAQVSADLLRRYQGGHSIRQICQQTGYSIGRVRRLLIEGGVEFRSRGGGNRTSQRTRSGRVTS